ncbi:MAG: amidohydrolase family protein [Alphaproteobacteria bacterium]|nr:amidohydrolase family protein [Alphaproteobacteria bacterium]MCB9929092.1 amidohydrolase family protein [Alphaproteobacteria bacterium]
MSHSQTAKSQTATSQNAGWLDQVREDALEPDLAIIDPHHHLWDRNTSFIQNRYLMDEIQDDLGSGHNVVSTVFVECDSMYRADGPEALRPVGEVEFVNGIAAMAASGGYGRTQVAKAIIGHADLLLGADVKAVLEALQAAAPERFRGIRFIGAWLEDKAVFTPPRVPGPGVYLDAKFREGFAQLAPLGLVFEAAIRHPQLPDFLDLARAFPDTCMVLDHIGGVVGVGTYAGRRDEIFASWRADMAAIARDCPNVVVKLGALNMTYCGFGWEKRPLPPTSEDLAAAYRPYYEAVIELFGPERCMFESNFPVDKVSCSYAVLWNAFKRMTAAYAPAERAALFHDTAARVYRI